MSKRDSERGTVMVTVAVCLLLLLFFLALAVDAGVGYIERRRVQAVTDAAALAAAQVMTDNGTDSDILATINAYVQVYNPLAAGESRSYVARWLVGATVSSVVGAGPRPAGVTGVLVTVTGHMPAIFANLWGIAELTASAQGGGGYSPLDVMLVLDRSGSMDDDSCFLKGNSTFSLRTYAKSSKCSSVMQGDGLSSDDCPSCGGRWDSYRSRCNWPDGTAMTQAEVGAVCGWPLNSTTCKACKGVWILPPQPIQDLKDASALFVDLVTAQLMSTAPRLGLTSYSDSVRLDQSLTFSLATVQTKVNALSASGYTNCEDAIYKARQDLQANGRWTAVRVILFMSDGVCNRYTSIQGPGCTSGTQEQRSICEAKYEASQAKLHDILIYSLGLGTDADQATLKAISSDPVNNFVYAPTGADLDALFSLLFTKIKRLRLVQ